MSYNKLANLGTVSYTNGSECDNPCVILTLDNTVQLMGDVTVTSLDPQTAIGALPVGFRPAETLYLPVIVSTELTTVTHIEIEPDGGMYIGTSGEEAVVHLNGFCFNIDSVFYNAAIGNNFAQGTSPMRYNIEGGTDALRV